MKWIVGSTLGVVLAMSAAAGAQSAKGMDKPMKGEMADVAYTGCVEAGSGGGLVLTHVAEKPMAMKGHEMPMKGEKTAMDSKEMPSKSMADDHMMPKSVRLVGSADLGKHSGQRVAVKGSLSHDTMDGMHDEQPTVKVASFKVVSKSCS